jgi:putative inorganic carbon (hco3(-)) transporter
MAAPQIVPFVTADRHVVRVSAIVHVALIGLLIGNLGRIPVFSTGERDAAVLVNDLCVAAMLGAGMLSAARRRSLVLDNVALWAIAFAVVGAISTMLSIPRFGLNGFEVAVSLGYLARWLFYFGLYVVFINTLGDDDGSGLWNALETTLLIFAAFGILQSLTMPNFAQMVYPDSREMLDWDKQGHRLVSTWLDPVFAGGFILIGLLIEIGRIVAGVRVARWKMTILTVAFLLTASRAALVGLIAGIAVVVLIRGLSKRLMRVMAVLTVLLAVGIPLVLQLTGLFNKLRIDGSAMLRVLQWLKALKVLADHWVIGIGFNAWGFVQLRYGYEANYASSYSLDGGLLFVAVMTGVIGLAVYLGMIGAILRRARRLWRDATANAEHRGFAIGTASATIAVLANAFFSNTLFYPFLMEVLWLIWALVFLASRAQKRRLALGSHEGVITRSEATRDLAV